MLLFKEIKTIILNLFSVQKIVAIIYANVTCVIFISQALMKDESKTARVVTTVKPVVSVYNAAGKLLGQMRVIACISIIFFLSEW